MRYLLQTLGCSKGVVIVLAWLLAETENFQGRIVSVQEQKISVTIMNQQKEFAVSPATKITLDGKAIKVTELPIGGPVSIMADRAEPNYIAKQIDAMSMK